VTPVVALQPGDCRERFRFDDDHRPSTPIVPTTSGIGLRGSGESLAW
jgi:hypothetical protein